MGIDDEGLVQVVKRGRGRPRKDAPRDSNGELIPPPTRKRMKKKRGRNRKFYGVVSCSRTSIYIPTTLAVSVREYCAENGLSWGDFSTLAFLLYFKTMKKMEKPYPEMLRWINALIRGVKWPRGGRRKGSGRKKKDDDEAGAGGDKDG